MFWYIAEDNSYYSNPQDSIKEVEKIIVLPNDKDINEYW